MLASDRKQRIRDILLEYMHVDVSSLCTFLHVSPATIRRDLDALEQEGFLLKTYGGAILNEGKDADSVRLKNTADPFEREKKAIAAFAVNLVEEQDVVFLGGGAICAHMARLLRVRSRVSIVTNNVSAATELLDVPGLNVVLVGGDVQGSPRCAETTGEIAMDEIARMFFNKCFLSFDGISVKRGYTMDSMTRLGVIRSVLRNTDVSCALTDSGSLGKTSLYSLGNLEQINQVVAPISMPDELKQYYLSHDIRLYDVSID